ncbi:MAG: hypothetical protein ACRDKL_03965, partial [Solirubrobacteraceae bacterium]
MDRNIMRRRLGVFASSAVLATGLVLAAGGTAFAQTPGLPGVNGVAGTAGASGGVVGGDGTAGGFATTATG